MGSDGYFYFGAAKNLPGVRELFEKNSKEKERKKERERMKFYKPCFMLLLFLTSFIIIIIVIIIIIIRC